MAFIADWLNEGLQAKQADLIVDDTLSNLRQRSGLLDQYLPLKTYDGRKFLAYVVKEINTIASIVAYGAELPTASQGGFRKITAEMLKMGLTIPYDEETLWDMKEAAELATAKGVLVQDIRTPDGTIVQGSNNELAKYLFGSLERLVKSMVDLLDALTWQVLYTGAVNYTDSRTNVTFSVDYKEPGATYNMFPASLAGDAVKDWVTGSAPNGIQDLYSAVDNYVDVNGFLPDAIAMSRKAVNALMQQATTKNAASSLTVTQVGTVSPNLLAAVLDARGIPNIITFDEQYELENTAKVVSAARFLPTNRYVFLSKNMGERALGQVLEAGNSGTRGIYTVAREIQKIPPVDALQTVATGLPLITRPKYLGSQIIATAV